MTTSTTTMDKVSWMDVRLEVQTVNPALAKAIDEVEPGSMYLYRVSYPYGEMIVENGRLRIPIGSNIYPLNDARVPPEIQRDLSYLRTIPVGIILQGCMEPFMEDLQDAQNIAPLPYWLISPGSIFMLWALFYRFSSLNASNPMLSTNESDAWSCSAGARSLFLTSPITQANQFAKLIKHYQLDFKNPDPVKGNLLKSAKDNDLDLWSIVRRGQRLFQQLASHPDAPPWRVEMIYFPKAWIDKLLHDPKWYPLERHLTLYHLQQTGFQRETPVFERFLSRAAKKKNISDTYLLNVLKHIYIIGTGRHLPGFVYVKDDSVAPVNFFKSAFTEVYRSPDAPTIMCLGIPPPGVPFYYLLNLPTHLFFHEPKMRSSVTRASELDALQEYMAEVYDFSKSNPSLIQNTIIDYTINNQYDFFTNTKNTFKTLKSIDEMLSADPVVQQDIKKYSLPASSKGSFYTSVVRIQRQPI